MEILHKLYQKLAAEAIHNRRPDDDFFPGCCLGTVPWGVTNKITAVVRRFPKLLQDYAALSSASDTFSIHSMYRP